MIRSFLRLYDIIYFIVFNITTVSHENGSFCKRQTIQYSEVLLDCYFSNDNFALQLFILHHLSHLCSCVESKEVVSQVNVK